MNQIVLLSALAATTGWWGGGRPARMGITFAPPIRTCAGGSCGVVPTPVRYSYYYPTFAAAAPQVVPPAPQAAAPVAQPAFYPSAAPVYYYAPMSACGVGGCYRR